MVDDGEGPFKRPGAVPFNWEIRPGIPKTRNPQPDDDDDDDDRILLQPPKKLPPLRLKQLPPSNPSSPSSPKTRSVSPFDPPPSSFKLKPPADSHHHSSGPPTPYWPSSSDRARLNPGFALRRWRLLKSLVGLKKSKSGDLKKTVEESTSSSSESDIFYESERAFYPSEGSSPGSVATRWGSPQSSFSSRRCSTLRRQQSDLSSSEKKTILMMARERLG